MENNHTTPHEMTNAEFLEKIKQECENNEELREEITEITSIYNKDLEKMNDLQMFNNKLVKSNKTANRDFFILAAAYVATLMLMIYLFIR